MRVCVKRANTRPEKHRHTMAMPCMEKREQKRIREGYQHTNEEERTDWVREENGRREEGERRVCRACMCVQQR